MKKTVIFHSYGTVYRRFPIKNGDFHSYNSYVELPEGMFVTNQPLRSPKPAPDPGTPGTPGTPGRSGIPQGAATP